MKDTGSKGEILFIHTGLSSFVKKDQLLLSKYYQVISHHYLTGKYFSTNLISQLKLLFTIIRHLHRIRYIFIWFADYHSFLPVLLASVFKKYSLISLGGYDVTHVPEIRYGSFSNPIRKFCTSFSLKYSSYLLAVDGSLLVEARSRIKNIKAQLLTVPTAFDPQQWYRSRGKENVVLTVGMCDSMQRIKLKGLDIFVESAGLLPEYDFLIIGMKPAAEKLMRIPPNVKIFDYVKFNELRDSYSKAKVYAQFSMREGLPSAVCEAMLCECIPVGTNVNGIPTAIGDCGYIMNSRNSLEGAGVIKKAMESPLKLGLNARKRIIEKFSNQRREETILSLLGK